MSEPTFATLDRLLSELGFAKRVVPGARVVFVYPDSDAMFVLRPYRDDEPVEPASLQAVRYQLDVWGILEHDEFDEQIRQLSLAG